MAQSPRKLFLDPQQWIGKQKGVYKVKEIIKDNFGSPRIVMACISCGSTRTLGYKAIQKWEGKYCKKYNCIFVKPGKFTSKMKGWNAYSKQVDPNIEFDFDHATRSTDDAGFF